MTEPPSDVRAEPPAPRQNAGAQAPRASSDAGGPPRLGFVIAGTVAVGAVLDLFCLLLLPYRLGGHLVPLGPLLVLVGNAVAGAAANWLAADRTPAQVLVGVALLLSALAALKGPGGDVLVTTNLFGMYLLFILAACLGAGLPLFRRGRPH